MKASGPCLRFAFLQEQSAYSEACPDGTHKKCANAGSIVYRIELFWFGARPRIGAKKRFAFAPAATSHDCAVFHDHKVSLVANELSIHAPRGTQRRLYLFGCIIASAQFAHGCGNETLQFLGVV